VATINVNAALTELPQDFISDGLHLNNDGYALVALTVYQGLETSGIVGSIVNVRDPRLAKNSWMGQ
jgi:hypothetical protein